ncbi:FAD-binding domain-containing protein [Roseobacter sp. HKCCA0434]|uniref:FAD-binding domain-containing protein n=1 Tax=Roseobacter sp. HKCCA0434 TaxID=3079297 RepID=UPI002905C42A|nr:FAD-binding domain-containing protein [Roseobacter sp. HKCCA0434]
MTGHVPEREAALAHLAGFVPRMGERYARRRNYVEHGADGPTSALSPWLSTGLLTEREVLATALEAHGAEAAASFVREVFWRLYFRGWLEHRPEVWTRYREDVTRLASLHAGTEGWRRAVSGETGIECYDTWLAELVETGWLHNHVRLWFASIWIFTLGLPWQLGADLFLRHLKDADAASNTLSWRWVAGLHSRGKHYVAHADNIATFTEGRFTPTGLADDPEPLAWDDPPDPVWPEAAPVRDGDLHVATQENLAPVRDGTAALVLAPVPLSPEGGTVGERFRTDAVARCGARVVAPEDLPPGRIVVHAHPTGPVADRLARLDREIVFARRTIDEVVWPHATKGYFRLGKQIPQLLSALSLS